MHNKHKPYIQQSGFGIIWILAIIVIIIALGCIGLIVANKHTKTTPASASAQTTDPSPAKITSPTPAGSDAKQPYYMSIKEWGITIPLSDTVKDAIYTTAGSSNSADGLPDTIWISLSSLNGTSCDVTGTGPTEKSNPVGAMLRLRPDQIEPIKGVSYKSLYPSGATLDGYYYVYVPGQNATCLSKDKLQPMNDAFTNATKNATQSKD